MSKRKILVATLAAIVAVGLVATASAQTTKYEFRLPMAGLRAPVPPCTVPAATYATATPGGESVAYGSDAVSFSVPAPAGCEQADIACTPATGSCPAAETWAVVPVAGWTVPIQVVPGQTATLSWSSAAPPAGCDVVCTP